MPSPTRRRARSVRPGHGRAASVLGSLLLASLLLLALDGALVVTGAAEPSGPSTPSADASGEPSPSVARTRRPRPRQTLPPIDPLPHLPADAAGPRLARDVVAYLPYWMVDGSYTGAPRFHADTDPWIRDGRLTDLVLFAVGVRRDGSLRLDEGNARFVLGEAATRIIRAAHERGIRVLVSFVSGGYDNNEALFGDPGAVSRFVEEATALVALRGLDGADLDVELIHRPWFRNYALAAGLLRASLRATNPAAIVSVATNGARSGATMARMALAAGADRAFLMGYAYRGRSSSPVGSISPLTHPTYLDLLDSIELYRERGVDLGRVVLGLPLYGMTWPVTGPEPHASRAPTRPNGAGRTISFHRAMTRPLPPGATVDTVPDDPSARMTWWDPDAETWWQTYFDTPETWRPKVVAAAAADLGGVGMWALGYDGALEGYPRTVEEVLARPAVANAWADRALIDGLDVRIGASFLDTFAPTHAFALSGDGVAWTPWLGVDAAAAGVPWRLLDGPDGPRQVWVRSRDRAGEVSAPLATTVVVDRAPPTIAGPTLVPMPGGWRIEVAAEDPGGVERLRVRSRVGDGGWSAWHPLGDPVDQVVAAPTGTRVWLEVEAVDRLGHRVTGDTTAAR